MSRQCDICQKKPKTAVSRSHSNIATKRKQYPNLQSKKMNGVKMKLCSTCIKTLKKV
ncbi:50S ribosomal protein L28 [Patescibacteria group bacterium]